MGAWDDLDLEGVNDLVMGDLKASVQVADGLVIDGQVAAAEMGTSLGDEAHACLKVQALAIQDVHD